VLISVGSEWIDERIKRYMYMYLGRNMRLIFSFFFFLLNNKHKY